MAFPNFQVFTYLVLYFAVMLTSNTSEAKQVGVAGKAFTTTMEELEEPYRVTLRNPCGINHVDRSGFRRQKINLDEINSRMLREVNTAIELLQRIEIADPNVGECGGLGPLKTIPRIPAFENLRPDEIFEQMYKIGLYFASHLKIMILDRQMVINGTNGLTTKYLRCGTEKVSLMDLFQSLTRTLEDMLCVLVVHVSDTSLQESFGRSYNELMRVPMLRFQSSCSSMEVRDCLVIDELYRFLNLNILPMLEGLLVPVPYANERARNGNYMYY